MDKIKAKIVSVSRRTDIPALYTNWFLHRIDAGFVKVKNPFNPKQITHVSLLPDHVLGVVFWTRNAAPLLPHLEAIASKYRFYCHWTLNAYPAILEQKNPNPDRMVQAMKILSQKTSPQHLVWRYDPIIISNQTDFSWHLENFDRLCEKLRGTVTTCITSFLDVYRKTKRNMQLLADGIALHPTSEADQVYFIGKLANISKRYGIELQSCCEDHLVSAGIVPKARCVDLNRLKMLYPELEEEVKLKATRDQCGCFESQDIGAYDSCVFKCTYCYANQQFDKKSLKRHAQHDELAAHLI